MTSKKALEQPRKKAALSRGKFKKTVWDYYRANRRDFPWRMSWPMYLTICWISPIISMSILNRHSRKGGIK